MKISTRLKLAALVSAGLVAAIGAALLSTTQQLKKELNKNEAAVEFLRAVTAVRYLTLEYVLRHEERSQVQWHIRHASLSTLLASSTAFNGTEEQEIIDGFSHSHVRIGALFDQLTANQRERNLDKKNDPLLEELEARLTGQILNKVQAMISDVSILTERSRIGVQKAQQRTILAVAMFCAMALVIAIIMYQALRRVMRPLSELHDGIAIVGEGNLDFRLDATSQDEIGDLARAFDGMTEQLKGTTVSRDELANVNEALKVELVRRQLAEGELMQSEEELQRTNQALVQSNLELQRFAYVASHDLQTPLRSIAGFVQLIQSEYAGRLDDRADDWMRRTVYATKVLQTSIRDLLAYSQVGSEERPFEQVPFREILDDVLLLLDAAIQDSKAQVTYAELPTLLCDRSQLVQLMQNLIGNALKYCIEAPRIHLSAENNGAEWVISARDNGIGIEPRHFERIFEIFKRLHNEQKYAGSGIGLAVCRRVVHRHGGRIWVESEPGQGSIFYFTIPERKAGNA